MAIYEVGIDIGNTGKTVEKEYLMTERKFNIEILLYLVIMMATILGSTISIYLHTSAQIDAIHEEMKNFHGRLCAIEERNKEKR